jgi:hypothetical protein
MQKYLAFSHEESAMPKPIGPVEQALMTQHLKMRKRVKDFLNEAETLHRRAGQSG